MTLQTPCVEGATNTVRFDVKREHHPCFAAVPAYRFRRASRARVRASRAAAVAVEACVDAGRVHVSRRPWRISLGASAMPAEGPTEKLSASCCAGYRSAHPGVAVSTPAPGTRSAREPILHSPRRRSPRARRHAARRGRCRPRRPHRAVAAGGLQLRRERDAADRGHGRSAARSRQRHHRRLAEPGGHGADAHLPPGGHRPDRPRGAAAGVRRHHRRLDHRQARRRHRGGRRLHRSRRHRSLLHRCARGARLSHQRQALPRPLAGATPRWMQSPAQAPFGVEQDKVAGGLVDPEERLSRFSHGQHLHLRRRRHPARHREPVHRHPRPEPVLPGALDPADHARRRHRLRHPGLQRRGRRRRGLQLLGEHLGADHGRRRAPARRPLPAARRLSLGPGRGHALPLSGGLGYIGQEFSAEVSVRRIALRPRRDDHRHRAGVLPGIDRPHPRPHRFRRTTAALCSRRAVA